MGAGPPLWKLKKEICLKNGGKKKKKKPGKTSVRVAEECQLAILVQFSHFQKNILWMARIFYSLFDCTETIANT